MVLRGNRYAYDQAGNREWKASGTGGNAGLSYLFSTGDRLGGWHAVGPSIAHGDYVVITNGVYAHDSAGCLTNVAFNSSDGTVTSLGLVWNSRYLLSSVVTNGVESVSYGYDSEGRLLTRTDVTSHVGRVYDGEHLLHEVEALTGGLRRSFTHGPWLDRWLGYAVYENGTTNRYTFVTDVAGTVFAVADESGVVVERYEYDAWGRVLAVYDRGGNRCFRTQIGNTILWKGGEYDWDTGFYIFRARWYDPVTGRWLSKDPIGLSGGLNLYAYCNCDPVNFNDPTGTVTIDVLGGLIPMHSAVARRSYVGGSLQSHMEYANSANAFRGFEGRMLYGSLGIHMSAYMLSALAPVAGDALLYEIGQKTLPDSIYNMVKDMHPIERGRWLIGIYGLWRALLPQGRGWVLGIGKTFTTGPTPLGWIGAIGLGAGGMAGLNSFFDRPLEDQQK